ncbi:hypothetical protein BDZ91DRAFT_788197 [Kalaharituber pfeilii]|nr:hypothetical protein BDZ91DRAFT_788197 [Kalaharituber pfeilii]
MAAKRQTRLELQAPPEATEIHQDIRWVTGWERPESVEFKTRQADGPDASGAERRRKSLYILGPDARQRRRDGCPTAAEVEWWEVFCKVGGQGVFTADSRYKNERLKRYKKGAEYNRVVKGLQGGTGNVQETEKMSRTKENKVREGAKRSRMLKIMRHTRTEAMNRDYGIRLFHVMRNLCCEYVL